MTSKNEVSAHAPLLDRLRGRAFLPGVHYATQAETWMHEAADEIERLRTIIKGKTFVTDVETAAVHPDDAAVDRFAAAMKSKLARKRDEGRGGWDDPAQCTVEYLAELLISHLPKGDPVDIGNFSMMLHQRLGGDRALARVAGNAKEKPRGKPCTCPDTSSTACGVERGNKLGELWYCRRAAEKATQRRCVVHPENACPATEENPQCICQPPEETYPHHAFTEAEKVEMRRNAEELDRRAALKTNDALPLESLASPAGTAVRSESTDQGSTADMSERCTCGGKIAPYWEFHKPECPIRRHLKHTPTAPDPFADKYHELLLAVGNKYPGESRHATALRYIRQAEAGNSECKSDPRPAPRSLYPYCAKHHQIACPECTSVSEGESRAE